MIRFSCPHCAREYVLPDALARLPLLCKGCGHQLAVPESSAEPELPLEFFAPPPVEKPPAPPPGDDDEFEPLFEAHTPDIGFNAPPPKELRRPLSPPPPAPPRPPKPPRGRKAVGVVVDVAVVLLLVAAGVFLGEVLAKKGTRDVIAGANGPKFPQPELLMWVAPPVLLVLVYGLLASRGKSVGGWLRRRGAGL